MIELTEQQLQAIQQTGKDVQRFLNPHTNETFILISIEEYERLKEIVYDDSSWTREELETIAWKVGEHTDWDEYNDEPESP